MSSFKSLGQIANEKGLMVDGDWIESKDQDPNGSVRLLQLADVGVCRFVDKSSRFMTEEKAIELRCTFLEKGDILIARMPDPIGRACIFPGSHKKCVTVVDVCVLRVDPEEFDNRWLMYMINSTGFYHQILEFVSGTTRQRIARKKLEMLGLECPPLETQKQIAAVLEKADQLRKDCRQMEQELNSLAQSVFIDMFGDLRLNTKYTEKVAFEEVFEINSKLVDPRLKEYENMPHIGPEHLEKITGRILPHKTAKEDGLVSGKFDFKKGCVLFSKIRPNLKKVAIPNFDGLCSADMYPLEPIDGVSTKEFIWGLILSLTFDEYLQLLPSRANIPKINRKELSAFEFYLPELEDQIEYSKWLNKIQSQIDVNREVMAGSEANFNSLMQKAFKGELNLKVAA